MKQLQKPMISTKLIEGGNGRMAKSGQSFMGNFLPGCSGKRAAIKQPPHKSQGLGIAARPQPLQFGLIDMGPALGQIKPAAGR
ncbi:hypothetical protein JCM17846_08370 [Iodidimonas nitroreducens]|uniref:Uncharacterized protein n=1 Tax=Iodidimonas nitroreducens TaxID=1236968 RepID=A0A5A7N697_9PROT|nr:hypothetical protein JCM17846_08370 [Iodidimonas nitroreducens]